MAQQVSHAQRPPRQRLRSNGIFGNFNTELAPLIEALST
jgi:hypothetical protein